MGGLLRPRSVQHERAAAHELTHTNHFVLPLLRISAAELMAVVVARHLLGVLAHLQVVRVVVGDPMDRLVRKRDCLIGDERDQVVQPLPRQLQACARRRML